MKKRFVYALLIVLLTFSCFDSAFAFDKTKHDEILEYVLFGEENYKESRPKIKEPIAIIEFAAQLTIDQYGGNSKYFLEFLKKGGYAKDKVYIIHGLPNLISEIDIDAAPNNHRNYTHMGWFCTKLSDFKDIDKKKNSDWEQKWNNRKNLLYSSVNSVFRFRMIDLFGYDSRGKSFSALIYYIHILGDYLHDDYEKSQTNGHKIIFASQYIDENAHTLISELIYHSRQLFCHEDEKNTYYEGFERQLKELNNRTYYLLDQDGNVEQQVYDEFHSRVEDLKEVLHDYIPSLLMREQFFSDVFG